MTRWASHFVDDIAGLIHLVDDHYAANMYGPHPEMAFTRCGHVVTWNGVRAGTGTYVPTSTVLTCVRCAAGARDGHALRAELKIAAFSVLYGMPLNKVFKLYPVARLAGFNSGSILRRCARLAAALYSKGPSHDHRRA